MLVESDDGNYTVRRRKNLKRTEFPSKPPVFSMEDCESDTKNTFSKKMVLTATNQPQQQPPSKENSNASTKKRKKELTQENESPHFKLDPDISVSSEEQCYYYSFPNRSESNTAIPLTSSSTKKYPTEQSKMNTFTDLCTVSGDEGVQGKNVSEPVAAVPQLGTQSSTMHKKEDIISATFHSDKDNDVSPKTITTATTPQTREFDQSASDGPTNISRDFDMHGTGSLPEEPNGVLDEDILKCVPFWKLEYEQYMKLNEHIRPNQFEHSHEH